MWIQWTLSIPELLWEKFSFLKPWGIKIYMHFLGSPPGGGVAHYLQLLFAWAKL